MKLTDFYLINLIRYDKTPGRHRNGLQPHVRYRKLDLIWRYSKSIAEFSGKVVELILEFSMDYRLDNGAEPAPKK